MPIVISVSAMSRFGRLPQHLSTSIYRCLLSLSTTAEDSFSEIFLAAPQISRCSLFRQPILKALVMRGWLELQSPYGICPCLHAIFHPLHLLANLILLLPYTRFYISTHDCFSIRVVASLHVTRHACACWHCFIATQYLIQVCPHMSSDSAEHYCFWIISCIHIFAIPIFPI